MKAAKSEVYSGSGWRSWQGYSSACNMCAVIVRFPRKNPMARIALDDPRYYLNRHVQWLEFNRRVLDEARDPGTPLLERVKFLAITANNLDEFVEVRVASFLQHIEHGSTHTSPDGLNVEGELKK